MKVSIRKSKHQKGDLTSNQIKFASECITRYLGDRNTSYYSYEGSLKGDNIACDIYKTKTTISAIVWFIDN